MGNAPLTEESFAASLTALAPGWPMAVAVSGGPDSLALLLLTAGYARTRGLELVALTVDHGLRSEARAEALEVARICGKLGVAHEILTWEGDKPETNLQAEAREARYRLMGMWCREHKVPSLAVGHHRDDQVETFLMRLARGSGVDGLSAMAPARDLPQMAGVRLLRPLLDFPKAELVQLVKAAGYEAVEDPSNDNLDFDRVKMRQLRATFDELGLSGARIIKTAEAMREARSALEAATDQALDKYAEFDVLGVAALDMAALPAVPAEIGKRLLAHVLQVVSGRDYRPRYERLQRLYEALKEGADGDWTLHHAHVQLRDGAAIFWREMRPRPEGIDLSATGKHEGLWDGRFAYGLEGADGLELRCLGEDGYACLKEVAPEALPARVPRAAFLSLPALWLGSELICVPPLGYGAVPGHLQFIACG